MLYRKEANSRDRKSNIEKGGGGSIVEIRKEICLKYWNVAKCLNTFVAHCIVDKHALLKRMGVRARGSPWITSELKKRMHIRSILRIKAIRSKDPFDWMQFKSKAP